MSTQKVTECRILLTTCLILGGAVPASAQTPECATGTTSASDIPTCAGDPCPMKGGCDCPDTRDLWTVGADPRMTEILLKVNIFDADVRNKPNRNTYVEDHLDDLNGFFALHYITFDYDYEFFDESSYASVSSWADVQAMRSAHADTPAQRLNVYVTDIDPQMGFRGVGTFPWSSASTGTQGGIVLDGGAFGDFRTVLAHEVGHVLGLWHPHHGTTLGEMKGQHGNCPSSNPPVVGDVCSCQCYEKATGDNCDTKGDFCCDTPSSPIWFQCNGSGDSDPCSGGNFSALDYENFMSYSRDGEEAPACRDSFTAQQGQRMRCWMCDELTGWINESSFGRCCQSDGSCRDTYESCCLNGGGSFAGASTACGTMGACCSGAGTCDSGMADACCTAMGGTFGGAGTSCESGACCASGGGCASEAEVCCDSSGGTFLGTSTSCQSQEPACCFPDASCIDTTNACCLAMGGFSRPSYTCATIPPRFGCPHLAE